MRATHLILAVFLPGGLFAAPTVVIPSPRATIIGATTSGVDSFKGIPFAQPPVGKQRLKVPKSLTSALGTVIATRVPLACPQFEAQTNPPTSAADVANSGEDCLTLNVQRPSAAKAGSKLPVVYWMFGGGFEIGSTQQYDATQIINKSVSNGHPVMYVAVNYRVAAWGFLAGKEVKQAGISNLGLLD